MYVSAPAASAEGGSRRAAPPLDRAELDRFGSVVHVRDLVPDDLPAVQRLLSTLSPRSVYQRFLTAAPDRDSYSAVLVDPRTTADAVVAVEEGAVVGIASTHPLPGDCAEFAEAVADPLQGHGLGTLLLEALAQRSAARGLRRLQGEMLTANAQMVEVLRHAGLEVEVHGEGAVSEVVIDLGDLGGLARAHAQRYDAARRAARSAKGRSSGEVTCAAAPVARARSSRVHTLQR